MESKSLTRTDEAVEYTRKKRMQWLNRKTIREGEEIAETPVLPFEKLIDLYQITLELHITDLYIRYAIQKVRGPAGKLDCVTEDFTSIVEDNLPYREIEALSWYCYDSALPVFGLKNTEQVACMLALCLDNIRPEEIAKLLTPSIERFLVESLERLILESN